jgi:hypothetical protein
MMERNVRSTAVSSVGVDGCDEECCQRTLRSRAQGLVEYGLILALVAIVAIAGLLLFRPSIANTLSGISGSV